MVSELKTAMPEEFYELLEAYDEGLVSDEEFDRLQKAYLREAFLKVAA